MEVHKTADRGWAVRATINVDRGQVVGIFTGLVSTLFPLSALTVVRVVSELLWV